jgi:hypothetical protein
MSIDINEDRRLRVTWFKYQHILADMTNYYKKKEFIQNQMDTSKLSQWEATLVFEEEVKKVETQRRTEMNQIRKQVIAEKKEKKAQEQKEKEIEYEIKKIHKNELRLVRQIRKAEQIYITPRRSKRLAKKQTQSSP